MNSKRFVFETFFFQKKFIKEKSSIEAPKNYLPSQRRASQHATRRLTSDNPWLSILLASSPSVDPLSNTKTRVGSKAASPPPQRQNCDYCNFEGNNNNNTIINCCCGVNNREDLHSFGRIRSASKTTKATRKLRIGAKLANGGKLSPPPSRLCHNNNYRKCSTEEKRPLAINDHVERSNAAHIERV